MNKRVRIQEKDLEYLKSEVVFCVQRYMKSSTLLEFTVQEGEKVCRVRQGEYEGSRLWKTLGR